MTLPNQLFTDISNALKSPWLFSISEQEFKKCLGYKARGVGIRCPNNAPQSRDTEKAERTEELLKKFATIKATKYDLDDELLKLLKEFIGLTHCGQHCMRAQTGCVEFQAQQHQQAKEGSSQTCQLRGLSSQSSESSTILEENSDRISDVSDATKRDHEKSVPDHVDDSVNMGEGILEFEPGKDGTVHVSTSVLDEDDSVTQIAQNICVLNIEEETHDISPADPEPPSAATGSASGRVEEIGSIDKFIKLGIVQMHRAGSLRDSSPVYHEMHKPLKGQDMSKGIVYILQKDDSDELFKIGWTTLTAAERHRHNNNCYSKGSRIIYESDAQFQAARRAESLSHTILRHKNIRVSKCTHCGGGHREWFNASEEEIRRTVSIMEALVRLPGYVLRDGEMKLSQEAYTLVEDMSKFDLAKLGASLGRSEQESLVSDMTVVSPGAVAQDVDGSAPSAVQPLASIEDDGLSQPSPAKSVDALSPLSLGSRAGKAARSAKEFLENRSRTSTPETEVENGWRRGSLGALRKMATAQKNAMQKNFGTFMSDFGEEYKKKNK